LRALLSPDLSPPVLGVVVLTDSLMVADHRKARRDKAQRTCAFGSSRENHRPPPRKNTSLKLTTGGVRCRRTWLTSIRSNHSTYRATERNCLRKTPLFSQLSLCLSRACLGKMIVFICKWLKRRRFSHRGFSSSPKYTSRRPERRISSPFSTKIRLST
jgi:hypothetical protein